MQLNSIKPAIGQKQAKKRVGRGIGSGLGKTGGRGHKGQKERAGGYRKVGFEGGQMPLQRRMPKFGFNSLSKQFIAEIRLSELNKLKLDTVDLSALHKMGVIKSGVKGARIILSGKIERAITIKGLHVTKGALAAIEAAGGRIEV